MRLETGNRAFLALVTVATAVGIAIVLAACASLGLLIHGVVVGHRSLTIMDVVPAVVFLAPVSAGLALGVISLREQIRSTGALRDRVTAGSISSVRAIDRSAEQTGLSGRIDVVEHGEPFAFAYGLVRPRVVVSTALAAAPDDEVEAVLSHEAYHIENLDPLKVVIARTLHRMLFFLPVVAGFHRRYVTGRELAADRRAIEACGTTSVATALYRVIASPRWPELHTAAAMAAPDLMDARVAQLETGREPAIPSASRGAIAITVAAVALLGWASVASMVAMRDPMTAMDMTQMDGMGAVGTMWSFLLAAVAVVAGVGLWLRTRRRNQVLTRHRRSTTVV